MSGRESGDAPKVEAGKDQQGESAALASGENEGKQQGTEQELASKTLQIQSKRFYLDVKQNKRGRFIKIAEVGAGGRKSRLVLSMSTAAEFRNLLTEFSEFCAQLGPPAAEVAGSGDAPAATEAAAASGGGGAVAAPASLPEDGKLKSATILKDYRRYYLDLKENQRGRFLRVSQTVPRGGPRSQIAVPAQGMVELRDALTDLLDDFGAEEPEAQADLPVSRSLRSENKTFYFDIGQNNRGTYMRVSEVRSNFRASITLPERAWVKFRDIVNEYLAEQKSADSAASAPAAAAAAAEAAAVEKEGQHESGVAEAKGVAACAPLAESGGRSTAAAEAPKAAEGCSEE